MYDFSNPLTKSCIPLGRSRLGKGERLAGTCQVKFVRTSQLKLLPAAVDREICISPIIRFRRIKMSGGKAEMHFNSWSKLTSDE